MSLSDFEEIGFSDAESVVVVAASDPKEASYCSLTEKQQDLQDTHRANEGEDEPSVENTDGKASESEIETKPVILQLPPELQSSSQAVTKAPAASCGGISADKPRSCKAGCDDEASLVSSCAGGFGNTKPIVVELPPELISHCHEEPNTKTGNDCLKADTDSCKTGYDDQASLASSSQYVKASGSTKPVILQLPPELLSGGGAPAAGSNSRKVEPDTDSSTGYDDQTSLASSYLRGFGNMNLRNNNDDGDSTSSWSHVPRSSKFDNDDYASVAGSVISGFDLLSINGSTHRRCQRCTFLNGENAGICDCCGAALVANPCLDMDHQIALNLQHKEEEAAFTALREAERKRLYIHLPIDQASTFANDIVNRVTPIVADEPAIVVVREQDLTRLAFRFISRLTTPSPPTRSTVQLKYHFSSDVTTGGLTHIQAHGFRTPLLVAENMQAAFCSSAYRSHRGIHGRGASYRIGTRLRTIPEHDDGSEIYPSGCPKLGWIVVTCGEQEVVRQVATSSGVETVEVYDDSACVLPLVTFDVARRKDDVIRRLLNALTQTVSDFLLLLQPEETHAESPSKKSRQATDQHQPDMASSSTAPSGCVPNQNGIVDGDVGSRAGNESVASSSDQATAALQRMTVDGSNRQEEGGANVDTGTDSDCSPQVFTEGSYLDDDAFAAWLADALDQPPPSSSAANSDDGTTASADASTARSSDAGTAAPPRKPGEKN